MANNSRFQVIETASGGFASEIKVVVDKETGVNYMFMHEGYAGGLTVMVDENGDPIVSDVSELY